MLDEKKTEPREEAPADLERSICARYAARIRAYGARHLRDTAATQDLVQHVLLVVLEALRTGRIEDPARLDAYVLGTCRNVVLETRRKDARQRRIATEAGALMPDGYEDYSGVDRRRVESCLRGLDPRDRAVILATFLEDRTADEIAGAMKMSPGNVRVVRHRALARLQQCVEKGAP